MRTKFLYIIASFLFVSIAISSCLSSDKEYEYTSDASIRAFGIDTIHGKYYKFTIDQLSRIIYNEDSLPVGADTIIDKILIDTLSVTGWVTSGVNDTIVNTNDSVDLREPIKLKVHAADGLTTREYIIRVNVHKQNPDSLVWENMDETKPVFSTTPIAGKQKAILVSDNLLFVYTSSTTAYFTSTNATLYGWSEASLIGLPDNAVFTSVISFKEALYMTTENGDIYSSADGISWEQVEILSGQVVALLASFPNTLTGIQTIDSKNYFCTTSDALTWTTGEEVPADFPTEDIYYSVFTSATGIEKTMLVGKPKDSDEATVPWESMNGLDWISLSTTTNTYCPAMDNPSIMYYGGQFYIFGGTFEAIYTSQTGIAWFKTESMFLLSEEFKNKGNYSMIVDKSNYIWIIWGGNGAETNSVWRGRLNKLGFNQ